MCVDIVTTYVKLKKMKEKKINKESYVQIRVTAEEKQEIQKSAKQSGFDTVTAYLLWLVRKYGNK
jgi:hypothetical protein